MNAHQIVGAGPLQIISNTKREARLRRDNIIVSSNILSSKYANTFKIKENNILQAQEEILMSLADRLRKAVGMEITKTQRVLNAEQSVKDMRKHSNKLPTKAGKPKRKKKKEGY